RRALQPGRDRALRAQQQDLRHLVAGEAGRGRRDPAHRRDLAAPLAGARARGAPAGPALRLRLEARLPSGDRRVWFATPGSRRRFHALSEERTNLAEGPTSKTPRPSSTPRTGPGAS